MAVEPDVATALPRTAQDVNACYRTLLGGHQAQQSADARVRARLLRLLACVVFLIAVLTAKTMHSGGAGWVFLAAFAAVVVLLWAALRRQTKVVRAQRLVGFYETALARAEGRATQSGRTGTEDGQSLRIPGHLYERDLDLLGPDSLFGRLATVRTGPGERGLARYLLEPATHAETLSRQAAVKELMPNTELRERIAILGATSFHQISASFFDEWLCQQPPVFSPVFRPALLLTAIGTGALLLAGLTHLRTWFDLLPELAGVLLVQAAICLWLRNRVMPLLEGGARLELNIRLLADGLAVLQRGGYTSAKLQALERAAREPAGAVASLTKLSSSLAIVEQRKKEYFLLLSLLLAAGTQAAISIAAWKRKNAAAMRLWLDAWAEFEALNAIAAYAFENPEDAWPELLPEDHAPTYEASLLGHPLLPQAVQNDVSLNDRTRFLLISGSNMAGKSTLLRAVGINAVLAYAGAPVRAASLRLTPLRLGAALALTDSLVEGRSKFLAEVERLSGIVGVSGGHPVLFLVDEIFSGTNSADRRTAAAAVLDRLLAHGAIGALSTHDLLLTELATEANGGVNVHMASPDPDDPLGFDYKLKPGVNTASNALAIVRMMGLQVQGLEPRA